MTDDNAEPRMKHLDIVVATGLLILFIGMLYLGISAFAHGILGGSDEYGVMSCSTHDPVAEKEWLKSDSITSYEAVPEEEKKNMSIEEKDRLKNLPSFRGVSYQNLSDEKKDAFVSAINKSVSIESREIAIEKIVFYNNSRYRCEANPTATP